MPVPPATQIVDGQGAVWTLGAGQTVLRNSVSAAGGLGSRLLFVGGAVYVLGIDSNWWKWAGSGWINAGPTQPAGGTRPGPAPPTKLRVKY